MNDTPAPGWPVLALPTGFALFMAAAGQLRLEHVLVAILVAVLWFAGETTRRLAGDFLPAMLVAMGYDIVRFLRPVFVTPERVIGCELRAVELGLFAVAPDTTLPDFFASRHAPAFDLFFAIPYAAFIYIAIGYAIALFFRDRARMRLFVWSWAAIYLIGFVCWMAFPAAPPWYVQAHGCVIDMNAAPSAAGLARVDDWLGVTFFAGMYGRVATIFGALPSLHNASALLGLLVTWPIAGRRERAANAAYALWMLAGSVYLDHHWLIDGLAGWLCAAVGVLVCARLLAPPRR